MRAAIVLAVAALSGCGRVGFDALEADATTDTGPRLTYPQSVLAAQPVAYYRLGEQNGSTAREEIRGADATFFSTNGGVISYGQTGALLGDTNTAMAFEADGNTGPRIDAWGQFPAVLPAWSGDFTIEVFVKALSDAPPFYHRPIVICESYLSNGFRAGWVTGVVPGFYTDQAGRTTQFAATRALAIGVWTHVAYVRTGNTLEIFLDAQSAGTSTIDYLPPDAGAECGFGSFHGEPGHGALDELAIYDRALTEAELAAHLTTALR